MIACMSSMLHPKESLRTCKSYSYTDLSPETGEMPGGRPGPQRMVNFGHEKCWESTIPEARILSVSFDSSAVQNETEGRMADLYVIAEQLLQILLLDNSGVGQREKCPVVILGHGLGCFVIKKLVLEAAQSFGSNKPRKDKFLKNVKGFVFYSPFNHGVSNDLLGVDSSRAKPLTRIQEKDNIEMSGLNEAFRSLRTMEDHQWKVGHMGIVPDIYNWSVTSDCRNKVQGSVSGTVVSEASARFDYDDFLTVAADHHMVCKPRTIHDIGYQKVIDFVNKLLSPEPENSNSQSISSIVSKDFFETHFPDSVYEYESLIEAADGYKSRFGTRGDTDQRKREIAAFLAHVHHATDGLSQIDNNTLEDPHCDPNSQKD